jgi:YD repeat-containing protein
VPDRVKKETTPLGNVSYTYDAVGNRKTMTVAGRPIVNYDYDIMNRLKTISTDVNGITKTFTIAYDDDGKRASITLPNGMLTQYVFNNGDQLTAIDHLKDAVSLDSVSYEYDENGNRRKQIRWGDGEGDVVT